ncbi:MAG: hypothetical protein R3286_04950, partial [Gammaproteobacteria bacterium]|nr:hypothetical protein [Gammaproteobacteria bacterium]
MTSGEANRRGAARARGLPPGWPWFAVVVVLPFVGASLVLEFVAPEALKLAGFAGAFVEGPGAEVGHLGDRLTYAALAYVQIAATVVVIGFYAYRLIGLDRERRTGALRLLGVTALSAVAAVAVVRSLQGAAYAVTYLNVRDLLRLTGATGDFTKSFFSFEAVPYLAEVTRISIAGGIPFALGVAAVILAVPVAAAAASFPTDEPEDWKGEFAARIKWLQESFYALSVVLVTSTVAIMLFFQLPAEIALETHRDGLLRYARGLTVFWGATMTLTLLAAFAPALLVLRRRAERRHEAVAASREFGEWLAEQVPTTARRQIANLAAMLGPLAVGP